MPLPDITSQLTITGDGLEIDGNGLGSAGLYLASGSNSSDISGLVITGFNGLNGSGIDIESDDDSISACTITGNLYGILDTGNSTLIAGNVISGNSSNGVTLYGSNAFDDSVADDNYIGVDSSGDHADGNGGDGVLIYGGSYSNRVDGNVISANAVYGIQLAGSSSNEIGLNKIGVGANGETPLGNAYTGIEIDDGCNFNSVDSNVISANFGNGIVVQGATADNSIIGNNVGVGEDGETPLGNAESGIAIFGGAASNSIDFESDLQQWQRRHQRFRFRHGW